jgi:zinc protease
MQHELKVLKNNLNTLFVDSPGSTTGSVQVWFRAGSALEDKSNEGIAHFLEHMFFKGTKKRPGAAIAHEVESFGGEINAFTSFDYTCYYINTPNTELEKTAEILMDMVSNPEFKQDDLVPERGVVFEEYRRSQDNAGQYSFQQIQKNCFTGGYAHPILGNEKTIKNFSREQLHDFRNRYYNLSNALLVVSGDLKKQNSIIKTIESFKLPSGDQSKFPKFNLKKKTSVNVHKKETHMIQVNLCWQGSPYTASASCHEDLALNCLGHGESSPLYNELVLKDSLANNSACSTMFMNNGGLHYMRVVFPPKNINKVLARLTSTLVTAANDGFSKEDLTRIKNQYIASKVYDKESLESFTFNLGHSFAQTGNVNSEDEFIERIRSANISQVNTALRKVLSSDFHISTQIPLIEDQVKIKKTLEKFQSSLSSKLKKKSAQSEKKLKTKTSNFDSQVKLIQIKPGVELLYRQNTLTPTFVMHAYIQGGLTEETPEINGVYQILSGALTKGYKGTSQKKLNEDLETNSAALNSFSGKNAYGITMHAQSEHFSRMCQHFTGSLLTPTFASSVVKHDKEMSLRTIKSHQENPVKFCFKEASDIFFHKHPYAMPIIGTPKSIRSITSKKVMELHQKNLKSKNILITYCGDEELATVLSELAPLFDSLPSIKTKRASIKKFTPLKNQHRYVYFDREQTQIFFGLDSKPLGHKENTALKMLSTHLSGQSSDLFVHVRDRLGLCYSAQPVHFTALEAGYWGIYMASGHDKVDAAIKAIKKIIDDIKVKGLSKSEFTRIKKMIAGQNLLHIQTNEDYANIYSVTCHQGKDLDYYHKNNENIKNLDYEEFSKSLKSVLSRKWSTIIVGRSDIKS